MILKPARILVAAFLVLILYVAGVRAQNTDADRDGEFRQSTSYPPLVSSANGRETTPDSGQVATDQLPLTGVQPLALGNSRKTQNFLLPSFSVTTQLNDYNGASSLTYLLGHLDLHHVSSRSELVLDYTGGGMASTAGSDLNSAIQDLKLSDSFEWQRWSLLLGDEGSYLSRSAFGFGGVGGLGFLGGISQFGSGGVLGGTLPFLNTFVTPNQTIPTAIAPQLSNTVFSQVQYQLSPRSSWTAAGSYGLLRFVDAGYVNSSNALFQTGYNYQVNPVTSLAVLYRFDAFQFANLAQGVDDHVVQVGFAHRVTGRLSFQLAAGPNLATFRETLTGPTTDLTWSADTSITYQLARTALSLRYDHLLTAGSGVLVGAQTNQVQGAISHTLSRTWQGSLAFGYAGNRSLPQTTANSVQESFNYWYAAIQADHQFRPGMAIFFGYGVSLQGSNTAVCAAPNCGSNFISHTLSLGFNWGLRPVALGGR